MQNSPVISDRMYSVNINMAGRQRQSKQFNYTQENERRAALGRDSNPQKSALIH